MASGATAATARIPDAPPRQLSDSFTLERAHQAEPTLDADAEDKGNYTLARFGVQNDHYTGLHRLWAKPLFFLVGKQHLNWDDAQSTFIEDVDQPEWRQQPVTNLTYAVYRTALAKLTKNRPKPEVVPPSGDSEDREAAKLGEAILEFLWRQLKTPQKVKRALGWLLATGNVFLNVRWDPDGGALRPRTVLVEVPHATIPGQTEDVPCPCDETGEPYRRAPATPEDAALDGGPPYDLEREPDMQPIGEIALDVDDPLSIRFDPDCTDPEDCEEFFVAKLWPRDQVCSEFDVTLDQLEIGGSEETDEREDLEDVLSSVAAAAPDPFSARLQQGGVSQREAIGERILVIEYYRRPNQRAGYPEGRHWITAGATKVWPKEDDAQYPHGEAPVPFGFWPPRVPIIDTPIPGQPQGLGLLGQAVTLNEKYNFVDSKIGEFHVMMAMGGVIWVAPEDRGIQVTSEPGQVKVSKAYGETGRHPIREKLEGLPPPIYNEREVILNSMRAVLGMSDVDLSQRPEGVTSGRAFLVLQEASDAPMMPTLEAIEQALAEVGRRELVIAQQRYTEERTVQIRGAKGKYEFRSFTGADLRDGLDVRVQSGSSFPWSKSAQWDTKLSILTAMPGLVTDPMTGKTDREQLARFLDPGTSGLAAFESDEDPDLVEVEKEHAMFEAFDPMQGQNDLPEVAFWQNHPAHQVAHYNFMKRDYARFLRWSEAAQLAFVEHMRLTTQAVDQLAASLVPPLPGAPGSEAGAGGGAGGGAGEPGPQLSIVPSGGTAGRAATPTANRHESQMQLTKADRASAGQ